MTIILSAGANPLSTSLVPVEALLPRFEPGYLKLNWSGRFGPRGFDRYNWLTIENQGPFEQVFSVAGGLQSYDVTLKPGEKGGYKFCTGSYLYGFKMIGKISVLVWSGQISSLDCFETSISAVGSALTPIIINTTKQWQTCVLGAWPLVDGERVDDMQMWYLNSIKPGGVFTKTMYCAAGVSHDIYLNDRLWASCANGLWIIYPI